MNEDLKVCGIYGIFDTLTGECLYVGQSKNVYERCKTHLKRLRSGRHLERFSEWFMIIGKDETRLRFELLESCNDTDDEKNRVEIKWFKILHPKFYGNAPSMNNRWGHSQETRAKISRRTYEAKQKGKHVTCAVYFYTCKMCSKFFASSVKKSNFNKTFCSRGCSHAYDKSLKMDTLDYNKVKDLYESGVTQVKIAKMFGVSNATVSKFMRDNGISTGYKRHDPGLKRKSRKTDNADVV